MKAEPDQARAVFEASESEFVSGDSAKTHKRNGQGVPVKQRDAEQGQRKQHKIEWNTEEENLFGQDGLGPFRSPAFFLRLCVPKTSHGDFRVKGQKIISA